MSEDSSIAPQRDSSAAQSKRLVSLDVFRGITIAGMVLVNNPGTWSHIYDPLEHVMWDGYTPTDFIFPFFLFIVGVAMAYSFDRRLEKGVTKSSLFIQVIRRSTILVLLGWILGSFPNFRLIMPFLLIIVGLNWLYKDEPVLALPNDKKKRLYKGFGIGKILIGMIWWGLDSAHIYGNVIRFGIGLDYLFPFQTEGLDGRSLRIPGVLERIGLCFFLASIIVLTTKTKGRLIWMAGLLIAYWLLLKYEQSVLQIVAPNGYEVGNGGGTPDFPPDAPYKGALVDWLDVQLFGGHLYSRRPDPEGFLSTFPAIGTVLLGVITGTWLLTKRSEEDKLLGLYFAGSVLLAVGWLWSLEFPMNKKIWTSSYVLHMGGMGLLFLAMCYHLIDLWGVKRWTKPFVIFGTNPIFVFFASGILARLMISIQIPVGEGATMNAKTWIYDSFFVSMVGESNELSSFLFAVTYILLWLGLTWPLYHAKIFLKI